MLASFILILISVLIYWKDGFKNRFNKNVITYDRVKSEALPNNRISEPIGLEDALNGDFPVYGDTCSNELSALVWGDSHARSIIPAVIEASQGKNAVAAVWHSSTAPILDYIPIGGSAEFSLKEKSPAWADAVINQVKKKGIQNVILAARWSGYYNSITEVIEEPEIVIENFNILFLQTIEEIQKAGAKVYILREVPNHRISVPKALIKAEVLGSDITKYKATEESVDEQNKQFDLLKDRINVAGAEIIDVSKFLYEDSSNTYKMSHSSEALYYDNHHLTFYGAEYLSKAFQHIFNK
jgi:hypothetical protein